MTLHIAHLLLTIVDCLISVLTRNTQEFRLQRPSILKEDRNVVNYIWETTLKLKRPYSDL